MESSNILRLPRLQALLIGAGEEKAEEMCIQALLVDA